MNQGADRDALAHGGVTFDSQNRLMDNSASDIRARIIRWEFMRSIYRDKEGHIEAAIVYPASCLSILGRQSRPGRPARKKFQAEMS